MLKAQGLYKSYGSLPVLQGVDLEVAPGEVVALLGRSGSGKSTLLHVLGTLDEPDSGSLEFEGQNLLRLPDRQRAHFRNRNLGFVFQFHHLVAECTALENVCVPAWIAGTPSRLALPRARQLLKDVGLSHRLTHRPAQLSGGEQQRVAVARALMNQPKLLLADEPTGNLDAANGDALMDLLRSLAARQGMGVVLATHHTGYAALAHRQWHLVQGQLVETAQPSPQA